MSITEEMIRTLH